MPGSRRLSQRISEGDGIAVIACVDDAAEARAAEAQGAKAVALVTAIEGIREATSLPLLWIGDGQPGDCDAIALRPPAAARGEPLEAVVLVHDEEELEQALQELDPEIFLLAAAADEDADPLDAVLELLADVPAGKLAIARVDVDTRDEVLALERAGMDAVLVSGARIDELVGHRPVDV